MAVNTRFGLKSSKYISLHHLKSTDWWPKSLYCSTCTGKVKEFEEITINDTMIYDRVTCGEDNCQGSAETKLRIYEIIFELVVDQCNSYLFHYPPPIGKFAG